MSPPRNVLKHKNNFGTSNGRFDRNKRMSNDTNRHGTTINNNSPDIIGKTENSYASNKRPKTGIGRRPEENRKLRDVNPLDSNFDVGDSLGKMIYSENSPHVFNGREPHSTVGNTKKRKNWTSLEFEPLDIARSRQTQGAIHLINNRNSSITRNIKQSNSGFHSSTEVRNQRINEYDDEVSHKTFSPIPKSSKLGGRNSDANVGRPSSFSNITAGRERGDFISRDKNAVSRRERGEENKRVGEFDRKDISNVEKKLWSSHCPPPALRKKQHPTTSKQMLPKGEKNPQRDFMREAAIVNLCDDKNDNHSLSESSLGSINKSSFSNVSPKDSDCISTFSVKTKSGEEDSKHTDVEEKEKLKIAPSIENALHTPTSVKLSSPDENPLYRKKSYEMFGSVNAGDCLEKVGRKVLNIGKTLSREAGSRIRTLSQKKLYCDSKLDQFNQEPCNVKIKGDASPPYDVRLEPENSDEEKIGHQLSNTTDSFATSHAEDLKRGKKKRSFLQFTKMDNPDLEGKKYRL